MPLLADRAVVLGASMSGLLAARVLADFFGNVTVIERDELTDSPADRRGVPQGRHAHALLMRGAHILRDLFPGLLDDMVADGAPVWDDGELSKLSWSFNGHLLVRSGKIAGDHKEMAVYCPSRPFLEHHVRSRLQAMQNVTIHGGRDIVGFTSNSERSCVTGVQCADRTGNGPQEIPADLIVDARGRGSNMPAVLEDLGYRRPDEDRITMHTAYVSQLFRIPPGTLDQKVIVVSPAPGRPRGLFMRLPRARHLDIHGLRNIRRRAFA